MGGGGGEGVGPLAEELIESDGIEQVEGTMEIGAFMHD